MVHAYKRLALASASALALAASPALAAGTEAGTTITNTVTVNFNVGGFSQVAEVDTDEFVVDRKVDIVVAEVNGTTTQVSPGQTQAVTVFTVTNTSNDTLDFVLSSSQQTGGASAYSGADSFDATNVRFYIDENGDGLLDAGDTLVTFLDEVAADDSVRVLVVVDIPTGLSTDAVAAIDLIATAHAGGAAGTQGALLVETTGADTAGVDTVFADTAGSATGDGARDGSHSAKADYTILAAALSAAKTSRVVSDPFNGTDNPKAIPGAVVEYCIAVSNAAGSATATNIVVTDPVPGDLTYVAGSVLVNGTVDGGGTCLADGGAGGSFAGTTVTGPINDIAAGQTLTVVFQATVN